MGENGREVVLEWLAMILFYATIQLSFKESSVYFFQFVFALIGVTLSIGAYMIINQQKQEGEMLKIIIITAIYKNMMAMFIFVAILLEIGIPFSIINLRVQLNLLDLWCICICYIYLYKYLNILWCTILVGLGFCVCTFIGSQYLPMYISSSYKWGGLILEELMMFISIIILLVVILRKEHRDSKSYLAFALFLGCKILDYFIVSYHYLSGYLGITMLFLIIRTMEYYYILKCTYMAYWEEPWKEKICHLNKVEYSLSDSAYYRDMIVNLSHELKTPINVISSATELLKLNLEQNKEVMNDLKEMRRYCNETMRIIGNMIDIHKLRGGYTKVTYRAYNVVALIDNVVEAYSRQYKDANLVFNPYDEEIYGEFDQALFQQMILYIIYAILKNRRYSSETYIEIKEEGESEGQMCIQFIHSQMGAIEEYLIYQRETKSNTPDSVMAVELFYHLLKLHEGSIKVVREDAAIDIRLYMKRRKLITEEAILEESNVVELLDHIKTHYVID